MTKRQRHTFERASEFHVMEAVLLQNKRVLGYCKMHVRRRDVIGTDCTLLIIHGDTTKTTVKQ